MKSKLVYAELKTGYSGDGPAWIGRAYFSKSGKTIYFNGKAYAAGKYEIGTGNEYWISGVKKNGQDRRYANGIIHVDKNVLDEYLCFRGVTNLPNTQYKIIEFDPNIPKDHVNKLQNEKLDESSRITP